ncbi:hypothetical protein HDK77DRAFT_50548 [Phyllosticta capitalensis]|uniref:Uncharacterized protein n=1 Tax=Phyllosticta capitalensis TaxID=121624 RepID=A0ABR1YAG1_9PEZI
MQILGGRQPKIYISFFSGRGCLTSRQSNGNNAIVRRHAVKSTLAAAYPSFIFPAFFGFAFIIIIFFFIMSFSWNRRSTHRPWYSNFCPCLSSSRCMHTRRCDPDSEPYAIVRDQDNARELLITRPRLAWVRRRGGRGSLFRSSSVPRRVHRDDGFEVGLRGGGDADDVCCCGARSFDPFTPGCACCEERRDRRSEGCVHIVRRRSWGWARATRGRKPPPYDDRPSIIDEDFRLHTRRPLSRGPPPSINNLADRFSDLALNIGRLPPSLSSRPRLRSRSRPRFYSDATPSTPRTIPISIPRSRTRTQATIRTRHALSPRSRRSRRSRSLTRSLTPPASSFRLETSRSPPPTVRFHTPTPTPSTPVSSESSSSFLPPSSRRRGAFSAASGPPPPLVDLGLDRERERRPYIRRGNRLSPPPEPRLGTGLGLGLGSYRGVGLSSSEDDDGILNQLRRGRSMRRRRPFILGVDDDDEVGLGLGRGQSEGLHIPRMERRYAMPAARERQREQELGFGGRLRGEEGWSD